MAWILRLAPGEVMLAAAHNRDLTCAQRAGLGTAFIPRPTELGPGQTKDMAAEGEHSLDDVKEAIRVVQTLDPAGVGASDLRECLLKALVFGVITISICCHSGYTAHSRRGVSGSRAVASGWFPSPNACCGANFR